MDIEKELRNERDKYISMKSMVKQDIVKYGEIAGNKRLACSTSHGIPQYFIDGKYVSKKNLATARAIAQLDYCRKFENTLEEKVGIIENTLQLYELEKLELIYDNMCKSRKALIEPYIIPREEYIQNWINKDYRAYDRWDGVTSNFYTDKGERVRSKSELIIANELSRNNIPYRYEYPLALREGNRECIIHPDFIVLNCRTLKEYVVEHLGMMDKTSYYNASINKIDLLEKNGYLLGINYLILHETSINALNIQVLRKYIDEYFI